MQHLFAKQIDGKGSHLCDRNFQGRTVQPAMDEVKGSSGSQTERDPPDTHQDKLHT
jgi:hypothetical protein